MVMKKRIFSSLVFLHLLVSSLGPQGLLMGPAKLITKETLLIPLTWLVSTTNFTISLPTSPSLNLSLRHQQLPFRLYNYPIQTCASSLHCLILGTPTQTQAFIYFNTVHWPNGITIGKESKRFSDGRLIIDLFAETLGLPYLNASADMNGTSFEYGTNFAVAGSCINPQLQGSNNTSKSMYYHLDEQISRFFDFKAASIASKEEGMYPKPEAFSEALYTIDIGQNDVAGNFGNRSVSTVLDFFTTSVQRLLKDGAKYLWVHNTCPLGCLPYFVQPYGGGKVCIEKINNMSRNFNSELKLRIDLLRKMYPIAVITLVDMYSAKDQLIANPPQGFDDALKFQFCLGSANGTYVCPDPSKYLSWDAIHWTEAANKVLANEISGGHFSEPSGVAILRACQKL